MSDLTGDGGTPHHSPGFGQIFQFQIESKQCKVYVQGEVIIAHVHKLSTEKINDTVHWWIEKFIAIFVNKKWCFEEKCVVLKIVLSTNKLKLISVKALTLYVKIFHVNHNYQDAL